MYHANKMVAISLFPDTELGKDPIQNVVVGHGVPIISSRLSRASCKSTATISGGIP